MPRAQVRLAAIVITCTLFVGSWIAVARWGERSASVPDRAQVSAPAATPASADPELDAFSDEGGVDDDADESGVPFGFGSSDSVAPVQAPIPTTQS